MYKKTTQFTHLYVYIQISNIQYVSLLVLRNILYLFFNPGSINSYNNVNKF